MQSFDAFKDLFKKRLHDLFHHQTNINELSTQRGLPAHVWSEIMETCPLSVSIPKLYGGRGNSVKECLGILSTASYESLPLSLTFGINIALFLEPLSKYGNAEIQEPIFKRFLEDKAMGGLMITEPAFGSDALNMRTYYTQQEDKYHLYGQKHWQGLTGMADFWIVAARKKLNDDSLARDVEFFITDNSMPAQHIKVDHYYNNLGLYMIPYGHNTIDIEVPGNQKLRLESTGIKMMLDILHRSRMQFPGMGMGFIQRMLDEALHHCTHRKVSGKMLYEMDSVRYQISRIQAAFFLCSAMCAQSSQISGIENDLSGRGLEANSMKALVTDLMQESAQICVQLSGSSGYKIDHIAGRGIIDSRPFQIFEGSNEMLYTQIAEITLKQMKLKKESKLFSFLNQYEYCNIVASEFKSLLDFEVPTVFVQRQHIVLGQIIARLVCLQYGSHMVNNGFRSDLYDNCVKHVEMDIKKLLSNFSEFNNAEPILEYQQDADWLAFS